jgi:oxygen-independent coproporphyrinogen-3 oxidase
MTSLRTAKGMDLEKIKSGFNPDFLTTIASEVQTFIDKEWIKQTGQVFTLTTEGKLYADHIASELFVE